MPHHLPAKRRKIWKQQVKALKRKLGKPNTWPRFGQRIQIASKDEVLYVLHSFLRVKTRQLELTLGGDKEVQEAFIPFDKYENFTKRFQVLGDASIEELLTSKYEQLRKLGLERQNVA